MGDTLSLSSGFAFRSQRRGWSCWIGALYLLSYSDAICFCLSPVVHASTRQEIVVKHRRHMEDLMMAILGFWLNLESCRVPEFIG